MRKPWAFSSLEIAARVTGVSPILICYTQWESGDERTDSVIESSQERNLNFELIRAGDHGRSTRNRSGIVTDFKAFVIDSPTVIIPRGRYDRHRLTWEEAEECGRPSPSEFEMVAEKGHQDVIRHAVAEITISIFAYALHSI
ncbi:hypothetical protein HYFRA_00004011 [Hymenoscyphus fraxineus]|uniref:Uncharacterized protein n=1 Tax=Hymenoscyphus fraxineus TaxID=746836 RepID=A0A9N9KN20_9HELO|nr:hypothetical protein HYFRA_00004011 [Hymenoscyphus fraxineus]